MKFAIVFLLLVHSFAYSATIKQLLNDQNLVIVELKNSEKIEVGESFIASDSKNQCLLEVISVDKKMVTATSRSCAACIKILYRIS